MDIRGAGRGVKKWLKGYDRIAGVYAIINIETNKIYIGETVNFNQRIAEQHLNMFSWATNIPLR